MAGRKNSLCWKILQVLEEGNNGAISPDEMIAHKDIQNHPSINRCIYCQPRSSRNYARNIIQTAICSLREKGFKIETVERKGQLAAYKLVEYPVDWPKNNPLLSVRKTKD